MPSPSLFTGSQPYDNIPSCIYVPKDSSLVPILPSDSSKSKPRPSTSPPTTHPMITRSKFSLQALTTFCPSPDDLQHREPNSIHEALPSP